MPRAKTGDANAGRGPWTQLRLLATLLAAALLVACGSAGIETTPRIPATASESPPLPAATLAVDGTLVVPLDPSGGQNYKLHLLRLDGSNPVRLTPVQSEIAGSEISPAWSPDGTRLVFSGYTRDGVDLFTINVDGSDLRNLTMRPGHYLRPSWSPDGSRILFTLSTNDYSRIALIDPGDGQIQPLTDPSAPEGRDSSPVWSPDGQRITFLRFEWGPCKNLPPTPGSALDSTTAGASIACDADPITTLYAMDAGGSDPRPLLRVTAFAEDPRWSPDGATIALTTFGSRRSDERVRLVASDGSGARELEAGSVHSLQPRWSPDGSRLSVTIIDSGGSEAAIALADASGADLRRLAPLSNWYEWSPGGAALLALKPRMSGGEFSGRSDLILVDAATGQMHRILAEAAIGQSPAWRPGAHE